MRHLLTIPSSLNTDPLYFIYRVIQKTTQTFQISRKSFEAIAAYAYHLAIKGRKSQYYSDQRLKNLHQNLQLNFAKLHLNQWNKQLEKTLTSIFKIVIHKFYQFSAIRHYYILCEINIVILFYYFPIFIIQHISRILINEIAHSIQNSSVYQLQQYFSYQICLFNQCLFNFFLFMSIQDQEIGLQELKIQIEGLIQNSIKTRDYQINVFVKFDSVLRKQVNSTPQAKQLCKQIILLMLTCLKDAYDKTFKKLSDLEEFFTNFLQFQTTSKYLNLACYHICQTLSQEETFSFYDVAVCKFIKDNIQHIQQTIFKNLLNHLEQIYKKQEYEFVHKKQELEVNNSIMKYQNYIQILLAISENKLLLQRDINVFDDLCQKVLFKFIEDQYQQKNQKWSQVYSVKDYLTLVERDLKLNEELFKSLIEQEKLRDHYINILRIVYEKLLLPYKGVILRDERGLQGLLKEFQDCNDKESVREEIILILRVYSKFQDREEYFNDFKQNFQAFVRKAIDEQYKKETLHHELEKQKSKYKSLVKILCDIYDKFNDLIQQCFRQSTGFSGRYDLEMIVKSELNLFFISLEQSIQLTLQLCNYVHELTLQMARTDDQQQREENQDEIIKVQDSLLPYVQDSEYYLNIYYYRLASRLLGYLFFFDKKSVNDHLENEKQILDKMKKFFGNNKLKKLYKMITETSDLAQKTPVSTFDGVTQEIIQINKKKWPVHYEQIYKKQEYEFVHKKQELEVNNSIMKYQNYIQILLAISENKLLLQRDINVFDDLCQKVLFKFIEDQYQQKNQKWSQVYSVKDYLTLVERDLKLNEELFKSLIEQEKLRDHYINILRIVYEKLLLPYKGVILRDERGLQGLLKEFQDCNDKESVREEIILILRVYSKFQDREEYFNDFKQNFQAFVRKAIDEQYKKETLHHELEKQKSKYKSLVKILCDIYDKFNDLIQQCFRQSTGFSGRYDLEMIVKSELNLFFISLEQSIQLTLQLCNYVHELTLQMARTDDQQQREENQDEIIKVQDSLLPYVQDSEYYLNIYYYRLASRLLGYLFFFDKKSVNDHLENEKQILDKMKKFFGNNKLKKLYKMITETSDLAQKTPVSTFDGVTQEIIQINKKKWPVHYGNDQNIFKYYDNQKAEYHMMHNQQYNVVFSDTLSYVEIHWIEVNKWLMINCVQAAILFLYDKNEDPKSLDYISDSIKLEKSQVKFQLDRMVKLKILWNDEQCYYLNNSQIEQEIKEEWIIMEHNIYENERYINEIKPIVDKTQDFKYQLDACIMKVLKAEKRVFHTTLLEKVLQHFYPTVITNEQLKLSIEFLSKYQYISRDPKDLSAYLYE
ncbi:unnamed protein product [Paramecium octaurelia]|uniref:Cullin family profile domain-containing protein n=1 Tax=Paramecium octaurelia TaxID=43137 RepID=A0A8S1XEW5_PAROT|nr:unnamed protein product [Paramecium octaurelia]